MTKQLAKFQRDIKKFLEEEYPEDPNWKALYKFWMDANARYYGHNDEHIVDGRGDGGIDAIAYPPSDRSDLGVAVIQSKLHSKPVLKKDLDRFFDAVRALQGRDRQSLNIWLNSVKNDQLRAKYTKIIEDNLKLQFILISTGKIAAAVKRHADDLGIDVYGPERVQALFNDLKEGKTPRPDEITLTLKGGKLKLLENAEHGLYVFGTPLADFAKAYKKHQDKLFAGNVRYAIRNVTSRNVKDGIRTTLKKRPTEFPYFHNGITLVCTRIQIRRDKITITAPSIVNGAQTVTFVGRELSKIPANALVLVKAIELFSDEGFAQFETQVAMSSNTQIKVSQSDLSVTNPGLNSLHRFFRDKAVLLTRKKGESHLGKIKYRIDKDRLLQLFACDDAQSGPTAAKDKQRLYTEHSIRLFQTYSCRESKKKNALFLVQLDRFCSDTLKESNAKDALRRRKRARIKTAYFASFAAVIKVIRKTGMWDTLRTSFASDGIDDSKHARELKTCVKKISRLILAEAKRDSKQSNEPAFFKNREKVNSAVNRVVSKRWRI